MELNQSVLRVNLSKPQFLIYKGRLKLCLINYELDMNFSNFENWLFSIRVSLQK